MRRIYLDHNATTPLDPSVFEAMLPYLREHYGNPSSGHWFGAEARAAVEQAREQVAALLGTDPSEIVFTSGGSESDNWAIRGIAEANRDRGDHVKAEASGEHPAGLIEPPYSSVEALAIGGHDRCWVVGPAWATCDLAVHRLKARRQGPRPGGGEMPAALRQVQARLAQLDEAREASSYVLADLEARMVELAERATGKEQAARERVTSDEAAARRALTEKAAHLRPVASGWRPRPQPCATTWHGWTICGRNWRQRRPNWRPWRHGRNWRLW